MRCAASRLLPAATPPRTGPSPRIPSALALLSALVLLSACASTGNGTERTYDSVEDLFRAYHEFRLRINGQLE